MRIGILEDDPDQQLFLQACLVTDDHQVDCFSRASEMHRALRKQVFDLLILDWHLPDANGMDFMQQLREQHGWRSPILFITASQGEDDVVVALQRGADDFLAKPLRPGELRARVNALARRAGQVRQQAGENNTIGAYTLHREAYTIELSGEVVTLTAREYQLASLFFSHVGQLFSRGNILEMVWGTGADLSTRTIDTHISRLRRKLSLNGEYGYRLKSVYQYGYRLETVGAGG